MDDFDMKEAEQGFLIAITLSLGSIGGFLWIAYELVSWLIEIYN